MAFSAIGQLASDDNYLLVAAIDFGTTFSGYAFSFKSSPDDIKMNKNWGENLSFQSYKTPTSVLVKPDGSFLAFGFEAEQKYSEIMEEGGREKGHQMYRHFKMMLHDSGVSRQSKIVSTGGVQRNALDIFVMALRYLKDHLIETVSQQTASSPSADYIKWVLTVPAIWSDEAKQFMREAAFKAGMIKTLDSRKLLIALEPEAASIHCKDLDVDHLVAGSTIKSVGFTAGVKYLIIDAGGGTIDITAHEVLPRGQVKEVLAANGGPWGGIKVDANFVNLLNEILGKKFVEQYQKDCPRQFLDIMLKFELAKRSVKPNEEGKIVIPLSWEMGTKYHEIMRKDIVKVIQKESRKCVTFGNGALIFDNGAVVNFFKPVTDQIVQHISNLIKNANLRDFKYLLLVGGFGECAFLQKAIKDNFSGRVTVLIPSEAQLSIIKGAVHFGHRPQGVKTRVARKSYGIKCYHDFNHEKHNRKYLEVYDGIEKCKYLFDSFVQKGEQVETGSTKSFDFHAVEASQNCMSLDVYDIDRETSLKHPEYVDTPGFRKLGNITVSMNDTTGGRDRRVDVEVTFGGTEILVKATDRRTKCTADTTIDFLSN